MYMMRTNTTGESFPTFAATTLPQRKRSVWSLGPNASVRYRSKGTARRARTFMIRTRTSGDILPEHAQCAVAQRTHVSWTPKGGLPWQPVGLEPQWAEVM